MPGYTLKNLMEIEDQAPKFGLGDVHEARFARRALECERSGMTHYRIKPNARNSFGHRHAEQEEIYVLLSGSGRVKLDDEVEEVKALDAIRVAPKVARQFEANDDGLELLALAARHDKDAEMIEEGIF